MSGDYGPKTLWRAAKADFLSLTFFEIGLFGWMAIFQFGIFGQRLGMDNVVYWWMMQVSLCYMRGQRDMANRVRTGGHVLWALDGFSDQLVVDYE
jgi:hypothetical protein